MAAVLVCLAGLPGTGKSMIARAVGESLGIPVLAKDEIEAAMWRGGLKDAGDTGWAAYELLGVLAENLLASGVSVILGSVATYARIREGWRVIAEGHGARFVAIECVCSDEEIHRERLGTRRRDIPGWYELTWEDVQAVHARYEPVKHVAARIDMSEPFEENVRRVVEAIR